MNVTNKEKKRHLPMTKHTNLHAFSLVLAAVFVFAIISPVGQLAAQVAGY
jgi:hypothetical protein